MAGSQHRLLASIVSTYLVMTIATFPSTLWITSTQQLMSNQF